MEGKRSVSRYLENTFLYILLPLIIIMIWEIVCHFGNVKSYSMPAPEMILKDAAEKIASGILWKHIIVSFLRV